MEFALRVRPYRPHFRVEAEPSQRKPSASLSIRPGCYGDLTYRWLRAVRFYVSIMRPCHLRLPGPNQKEKVRRLGNDRPSLRARLGVGLSKPWGVWEGNPRPCQLPSAVSSTTTDPVATSLCRWTAARPSRTSFPIPRATRLQSRTSRHPADALPQPLLRAAYRICHANRHRRGASN
jgi:hypothetical protein